MNICGRSNAPTVPSDLRRTLRIMPNEPFPMISKGSNCSSQLAMVAWRMRVSEVKPSETKAIVAPKWQVTVTWLQFIRGSGSALVPIVATHHSRICLTQLQASCGMYPIGRTYLRSDFPLPLKFNGILGNPSTIHCVRLPLSAFQSVASTVNSVKTHCAVLSLTMCVQTEIICYIDGGKWHN